MDSLSFEGFTIFILIKIKKKHSKIDLFVPLTRIIQQYAYEKDTNRISNEMILLFEAKVLMTNTQFQLAVFSSSSRKVIIEKWHANFLSPRRENLTTVADLRHTLNRSKNENHTPSTQHCLQLVRIGRRNVDKKQQQHFATDDERRRRQQAKDQNPKR